MLKKCITTKDNGEKEYSKEFLRACKNIDAKFDSMSDEELNDWDLFMEDQLRKYGAKEVERKKRSGYLKQATARKSKAGKDTNGNR